MKCSRRSPSSASMIWESRSVPRVVTTMAWVSPRVNRAEPWVRGNTPVRTLIGRTVAVSRPSIRGCPSRIRPRTIFFFSLSMASLTCCWDHLGCSPSAAAHSLATVASVTASARP